MPDPAESVPRPISDAPQNQTPNPSEKSFERARARLGEIEHGRTGSNQTRVGLNWNVCPSKVQLVPVY